jgi:hypothetical protein
VGKQGARALRGRDKTIPQFDSELLFAAESLFDGRLVFRSKVE